MEVSADDIKCGLQHRYSDHMIWFYFNEMLMNPGAPTRRYADGYAIKVMPDYERIIYEIKVSILDFKAEIRNPKKRRPAMIVANQFYFAAPKGLLSPCDIPEDCGLLEAWWSSEGTWQNLYKRKEMVLRLRIKKRAPNLGSKDIPCWHFGAILRKVYISSDYRPRIDVMKIHRNKKNTGCKSQGQLF